ncbi:MAG: SDR family oxidoreductase [Woeseiaceae bacterium]|nr:SDR family oxidoreductase [Woeseiaceae bacterium]
MKRLLQIVSITLVIAMSMPTPASAADHDEQKAVLVTGASSGIGLAIAKKLAANGFYVYAGARKPADLEMLDAIGNISSVRLDVTRHEEIDAAVEFVKSQGRGLYGVVNNAGVAAYLPMNDVPEEDIDWVFDVNVYGPYRVNKAFAPMLIESGGRTTLIGSISGYLSGRYSGTYSMSKFATEAYTDAYAVEMADHSVHVSIIEPGGYKSRIREKVVQHTLDQMKDAGLEPTDEQKQQFDAMVASNEGLKEPDEVAEAALHVMTAEKPKRRYMVTPNLEQATLTISAALGKVAQLNRDQPYEFSRQQLIEMLDEALAAEY